MLDLETGQLEMVRSILRTQLPNARVWAFGSRVQGRAKRFSDLDLAIEDEAVLELQQLFDLNYAFSESDLPISVDVLDLRTISQQFRELIEAQKILVI